MNPSPSPTPFVSAHARARLVKILLIIGAGATGLTLITEALSLAFPPLSEDQEFADNPLGGIIMLVRFLFALFEFFVYIATVVFFCMWLHRVYKNLRAINPWNRLDNSPGWAVGSFFVPFVNLVVPYRAVSEVWKKSWPADETHLSAPGTPAQFPVWWTFWISSAIAGNIEWRVSWNESVPASTATIVSMCASVLAILAAVFAYMVVDAIDKKQEEVRHKLKLDTFPAPPPPPLDFGSNQATVPTGRLS